jgi:selenocysteine lyase/cysteine desulfurase
VNLGAAAQVERWRADTPGCAHRTHLNNAGAGLMPGAVVDAMVAHLRLEAEMGGYEAADARDEAVGTTYDTLAQLVGGAARNIAIVGSATAGFIQTVSSISFAPGDVIVTTRADYTSYQIQYLSLARRLGVRIVHAEDTALGGVDPDSVRDVLRRERDRVKLVAVSWIPTHSGLVQDVESVGAVCSEFDVPYSIDACQAVGQLPIDVGRLGCDYLSVTARKFLRGPRGIGFMYASDRALERGDHPLFVDMRGATWAKPDHYEIADSARRYEHWELSYALVLGLGAAARYALSVGPDTARSRAFALGARLRGLLRAIPGVQVLDRGPELCAIVTAQVEGWHASDVVQHLRTRGINTSATLQWFGLLELAERGVESAVRISPHYYNTDDELDLVADAIRNLVGGAKRQVTT